MGGVPGGGGLVFGRLKWTRLGPGRVSWESAGNDGWWLGRRERAGECTFPDGALEERDGCAHGYRIIMTVFDVQWCGFRFD
jgi:hypothetical protein